VGFVNKGNTCYANSILQAVLPSIWSQAISETDSVCAILRTVSLNLSLLKRSKSPVDPSNFLRALQDEMRKTVTDFYFNQPQDAQEVLSTILVSLKKISAVASNLFSLTVKSITSCDTCHCSETEDNNLSILSLPLKVSIPDSITERLKSVQLSKFCPICETRTSFSKESQIISTGSFVIIHIDRFSYIEGKPIRNPKVVKCMENLVIPISPSSLDDSMVVSFNDSYSLVATINHSGSLENGHYTAHVKDPLSRSCFFCNDKMIVPCPSAKVENNTSYVLFYKRN